MPVPVRTETTIYSSRVRRRRSPYGLVLQRTAVLAAAVVLIAGLGGLAFAGSRTTLATGVTVAGLDVGGLTEREAVRKLAARAAAVERKPVTFTADGRRFALSAAQLGIEGNWRLAVQAAAAEGDGFGPVRGFRRLRARLFGVEVWPSFRAYDAAVNYKIDQIAGAVDRSSVDARLVRSGLSVTVVEGRADRKLDRAAAIAIVVPALGSFDRGSPVALSLSASEPRVRGADLAAAAAQARTALSAPLRLVYGETRWRVPRWRIAPLLDLPEAGRTHVSIAGPAAERYLERLSGAVSREPQDARFQVAATGKIVIRPSAPGLQLDIPATARAISAAAFSTDRRTAELVVSVAAPKRSTEVANRMGIVGVVSSYTTTYGGTPGRLNNVQLVARLIDGTLIEPGATFSFNATTGERTADQGFQEAPVIINGELQNGIGGGVCQVSTTVFNAAFEAGLPIAARRNHALYISHYPLGRDATVNYPDLDLQFSNDTGHWLLLRTFVGAGSLTVNLYGTPIDRRVESTAAPLQVTGPVPVKLTKDPSLAKGKRVVEEFGAPPRQTSVQRRVFDANGTLLYDDTWRSYYVGEPSLVRLGTKKPKQPKQPKQPADALAPGTTPPPTGPPPSVRPTVTIPALP